MNTYNVNWANFSHAYGSATDVPILLREVVENESESALSSLWNSLCHQHTVYSASIVAVPIFLGLHKKTGRIDLLDLAGGIAIEAHRAKMPVVPREVLHAYANSLIDMPSLLTNTLVKKSQKTGAMKYLGIIAVLAGQRELGFWLFDADWNLECPRCDAVFPRFYDLDDN